LIYELLESVQVPALRMSSSPPLASALDASPAETAMAAVTVAIFFMVLPGSWLFVS
jgi:hypothetical protein